LNYNYLVVIDIIRNKNIIRYFFVAVTVVSIELVAFQAIYLLLGNYVVATVLSFALAVVLNWVFGRKFVFGKSHHAPAKEFTMVLIASLVGVGIQLVVVFVSVEVFKLYPLIGKILSIMFSFFWNYWFRAAVVYKKPAVDTES
jgi:putative flippase GtrA